MEIVTFIFYFGLFWLFVGRKIFKNIKRGLNRRWDRENFLNVDGITGGVRFAKNLIREYPLFPNEENSREWANKVIYLNKITDLLLEEEKLDIVPASFFRGFTIKINCDFEELDPTIKHALDLMEVDNKEEAAIAYFFALSDIKIFLKNKGISFDRETNLNSLIDQMLRLAQIVSAQKSQFKKNKSKFLTLQIIGFLIGLPIIGIACLYVFYGTNLRYVILYGGIDKNVEAVKKGLINGTSECRRRYKEGLSTKFTDIETYSRKYSGFEIEPIINYKYRIVRRNGKLQSIKTKKRLQSTCFEAQAVPTSDENTWFKIKLNRRRGFAIAGDEYAGPPSQFCGDSSKKGCGSEWEWESPPK